MRARSSGSSGLKSLDMSVAAMWSPGSEQSTARESPEHATQISLPRR